ncbi:MAG: methyltransferase domain-containing protein [Planctomycetaceae bacterium]
MNFSRQQILDRLLPLIHPDDARSDYVSCGTYYEWYAGYAAALRPRRVLEIGSRRGYSLAAMLLACDEIQEVVSLDNESYGIAVTELRETLARLNHAASLTTFAVDTQRIGRLPVAGQFDLIHVDGDHSEQGALHDLKLVMNQLSPRGLMVVDDVVFYPSVMAAVSRFLIENPNWSAEFVPSFRGHILLRRSDGSNDIGSGRVCSETRSLNGTCGVLSDDPIPRFRAASIEAAKQSVVGGCNGRHFEERWEQETPAFAQAILRHLPKRRCTILDYGCGVGRLAKEILSRRKNITILGVDASADELHWASAYVNDPRFVPLSPAELDQPVDAIYCIYVLQHVPAIELRQVIERMHYHLKRNGKLIYCSSDFRMAVSNQGTFFDDALLGVNVRRELSRLFVEEGELFDLSQESEIIRDLVTAQGCPPGSIPHPAKVYRRRDIPRDVPYCHWDFPESAATR